MNLKNLIEKLKLTSSSQEANSLTKRTTDCTPKEKGVSNEEACSAAELDIEHFINAYAQLALKLSDEYFERASEHAHDPQIRAQMEEVAYKRAALEASLARLNRSEETGLSRSPLRSVAQDGCYDGESHYTASQ